MTCVCVAHCSWGAWGEGGRGAAILNLKEYNRISGNLIKCGHTSSEGRREGVTALKEGNVCTSYYAIRNMCTQQGECL